ncbi:MAG: SCP2 sterol-binding domain-containing protein [Candidatus Lokiarchaeota archaeon]|nr:SCP2 sterol-binding domain-containing protein [Candidatus Lokiarchaeota archaeon]
MVDKELARELRDKIEKDTITVDDIPKYLTVIKEVAKESEEIQDEIDGWVKSVQFKVKDKLDAWISFDNGEVEVKTGLKENADVTLEMDEETAVGLFSGKVDGASAYMAGRLKVNGPLPDAIKFNMVSQIIRDELQD